MAKVEKLLTSEQYRALAQQSGLNSLMRELFSPIETAEECRRLHGKADAVRQGLIALHPTLFSKVTNGVLSNVPLRFVRDTFTKAGVKYLRWRNYANIKSGTAAWQGVMNQVNQPDIIREALAEAEVTRLVLNMQLGIIAVISDKLAKAAEELELVEKTLLRDDCI